MTTQAVTEDEQAQAGPGRRERKKLETREALRDAARRLFAEQGYEATTVKEIADAADVAERTFFRYFAAKEDLLLPDLVSRFQAFERATAARPAAEPPLTAIREAAIEVFCAPGAAMLSVLRPHEEALDPVIAARLTRAFLDSEDRLAAVLAARAGAGQQEHAATGTWAAVVAKAAMAAARVAFRAALTGGPAPDPADGGLAAELGRAFAILEDGCRPPGVRH
jgi:AcrR family transcriptional regulator